MTEEQDQDQKEYTVIVDYPDEKDGPLVARILDTLFGAIFSHGDKLVGFEVYGPDEDEDDKR